MGGSTKTTSSNTVDPKLMDLYYKRFDAVQDFANQPFKRYEGQRVAAFNPTQVQAQGMVSDLVKNRVGADALDQAKAAYGGLLNYKAPSINAPTPYTPQNVGARSVAAQHIDSPGTLTAQTINAPTVSASMLRDTDLSPYMNPFQQGVIDTTLADQERARQVQRVNDSQSANAARAFGGSRQGVADALTNEAYDRNTAATVANLRSAGFQNAQNAALADLAAKYGADTFNAGNQFAANQFNANALNAANQFNINNAFDLAKTNAGYASAADMFNANQLFNADSQNAAAANAASQFNINTDLGVQQNNIANALAALNLNMGAGDRLSNLSNQQLQQELTRIGALGAVGDQQQQNTQANLDAGFDEYLRELQDQLTKQQLLSGALGQIPVQQTQTTVQKESPGALQIFSTLANGLGSLGGFGSGLASQGLKLF
jgi:hypothetical protein